MGSCARAIGSCESEFSQASTANERARPSQRTIRASHAWRRSRNSHDAHGAAQPFTLSDVGRAPIAERARSRSGAVLSRLAAANDERSERAGMRWQRADVDEANLLEH